MIQWITGESGSGKTTLSNQLKKPNTVQLDGDDVRRVWTDVGFSETDRLENNERTARLAKLLEMQGFDVIVSTICPTDEIKKSVKAICGCRFIHLEN